MQYYHLEKLIAKGSFSHVYQATDCRTGRIVALKLMSGKRLVHLGIDWSHEVMIHSNLNHTNISKLITHFEDGDSIGLVLKYIEGRQLYSLLGMLGEQQSLVYILQLINALIYCHQQDICHCDVKAENVIIGPDDKVKLVDFGSAVHCHEHGLGSPVCQSPETTTGAPTTAQCDAWAVGILLYECLMGASPFNLRVGIHTTDEYQVTFPVDAKVNESTQDLIRGLLVFDPCQRLQLQHISVS
jgi:serine/threonine protein kinase